MRLTTLVDVTGRKILDVIPDFDRSIVERCGQVAIEGEPVRFEVCVAAMARWQHSLDGSTLPAPQDKVPSLKYIYLPLLKMKKS